MKKLTLITTFTILAGFLFGQAFQIDIPVDESKMFISTDDSKSDFKKAPYLIFEGINTQMRVIWQLNDTIATCQIFWGADSTCSLGNAVCEEYGDDHQHGYTIIGLTPGTKYFYRVIYDDAVLAASFRTAPPENATDLKFFVYGDTRADNVNHDLNSAAMIADYSADPELQSMTLFTGDHVSFGASETSWQNYFFSPNTLNIRKRMAEVPFISCLGNHALYYTNYSLDHETTLFGKYFPFPFVERRYWSFDYGPLHVTVLDQYPEYYELLPPIGYLDSTQMVWVEQDLAGTDKPWKIIIMHEPGWSCEGNSSGYSHPNNLDVQNLLQPLCEEYSVQIVFNAHNHYYARACKNGVYHITTAGGGAPLYEVEEAYPNVMHTLQVYHYCKVEIEGETMALTAITPDGDVIDEFVVDQNNRPEHLLGFLSLEEGGTGVVNEIAISASGQETTADETGYYGLELVPGYHEASFFLENYYAITENIEIFEGTETQLDTTLTPIPEWIDDTEKARYFKISPNPISSQARLCLNVSTSAMVEICIYNTTGICLKSWQFNNKQSGQKERQLDLRDIQAGIYFCRVQIGNEILTRKIIKVK